MERPSARSGVLGQQQNCHWYPPRCFLRYCFPIQRVWTKCRNNEYDSEPKDDEEEGLVFLTVPLVLVAGTGVGFAGASSSLEESLLEESLSLEGSLGDDLWAYMMDERRFGRGDKSTF